jgi:hypothetical protein
MSVDDTLSEAEADAKELESLREQLADAVAELDDVDRKFDQLLKNLTAAGE